LKGSPLEDREIAELPILDTGEVAYAVRITAKEVEPMWKAARGLVERIGRWPVATMCWGAGTNWREGVQSQDHFSRFFYKESPRATDVSPQGLLRLVDTVDVDAFIEQLAKRHEGYYDVKGALAFEIDSTARACGIRPTDEEVRAATINGSPISTHRELDRWLMAWEARHDVPQDWSVGRQAWFEGESVALLFLPVTESWDTLAYLNWYGAADPGTQYFIALGRRWNQQFGAELVAHYGTMLQCIVSRPPRNRDEAWSLAREHHLVAPCTMDLSGIALRHYALGLVEHDKWFLHERP
jgi:hypothetical protein